jgi:hypothetical protein
VGRAGVSGRFIPIGVGDGDGLVVTAGILISSSWDSNPLQTNQSAGSVATNSAVLDDLRYQKIVPVLIIVTP